MYIVLYFLPQTYHTCNEVSAFSTTIPVKVAPWYTTNPVCCSYVHVIPHTLANIYDELMQPLPPALAAVVAPESSSPDEASTMDVSNISMDSVQGRRYFIVLINCCETTYMEVKSKLVKIDISLSA